MSDQTNHIVTFAHCRNCARQKPRHLSMRGWNRTETGITPDGIQVFCLRCKMNVIRLTPDGLAAMVARGPSCDCCPGGMHRD